MCNFAHLGPSSDFRLRVFSRSSVRWFGASHGCVAVLVSCAVVFWNENRVCDVLGMSSENTRVQRALARGAAPPPASPQAARRTCGGAAGGTGRVADCRQARARVGRRRDARAPPEPRHTLTSYTPCRCRTQSHAHTHDSHTCQLSHGVHHTWGAAQTERKNAQCPSEHIMPRHPRLSRLSRSTEWSP